jgi:phage-related protein
MATRALATAFVNIVPGTVELEKYLKSELGDDVAKAGNTTGKSFAKGTGKGFKSSIGASLRPAIGIMAASFAAVKIKDFMTDAVQGALEAQKVDAALGQIAKTTGLFGSETGAVTKRLQDFADKQMRLTGVDDEVIKKGQAKLLTFKKIGDNADVMGGAFDRATVLMQDLAAAGFGDVESNAVLLGKALNDPVKGMSALRRVGVSLTAEQENQVKAFMEVNDIASAQDVILSEVESQVGGTAAASATATDKMRASWDDLKENLGAVVAPAFEKVADVVSEKVLPKLEEFIAWAEENPGKIKVMAGVIGGLTVALGLATVASTLLNTSLWANPIGLVVAAVAGAIGMFVLLYKNSETLRDAIDSLFGAFKELWAEFGDEILVGLKAAFGFWVTYMSAIWSTIITTITVAIKIIFGILKAFFQLLSGDWKGAGETLKNAFMSAFGGLKSLVVGVFNSIKRAVKSPINQIIDWVNTLIGGLNKLSFDIPGPGGRFGLSIPKIPKLADGGFVDRPTMALIGEAGPEVVTPLRDFERMMGMDQAGGSRPIQVGGKTVAWLQELVDGRAEIVVAGAFSTADQYGRQFV